MYEYILDYRPSEIVGRSQLEPSMAGVLSELRQLGDDHLAKRLYDEFLANELRCIARNAIELEQESAALEDEIRLAETHAFSQPEISRVRERCVATLHLLRASLFNRQASAAVMGFDDWRERRITFAKLELEHLRRIDSNNETWREIKYDLQRQLPTPPGIKPLE